VVLLAGDRAWKLRKPVRLAFLDFTALEARERDAREEWRLNRRFAPETYLGVRAVVRRGDDVAVVDDPTPSDEVVDWLVEMRRLPAEGMLDRILAGEAGAARLGPLLERFSRELAAFHAAEPPVDPASPFGTRTTLERRMARNLEGLAAETTSGTPPTLPATFVAALVRRVRERFAAIGPTLDARRAAGRVRDGHGDLHARNLCVAGDRIVAYDCLEFDANLRIGDVATDVGFLAMDLDVRGHPELATRVVDAYVDASGDGGVRVVERFFRLHYAVIRAFVDGIRLRQSDTVGAERERVAAAVRRYAAFAAGYAAEPALVILTGLPAAGKSTVARRLAEPLRAEILRSDVVRKELAGIAPTARGAAEIYDAAFTKRVYDEMARRAAATLEAGRTVVVDAANLRRAERAALLRVAASAGVPHAVVEVVADEARIERHLAARRADPSNVSDATREVYDLLRASAEPPTEIEPARLVTMTSDGDVFAVLTALLAPACG
jgi:aminoglycoside phosphotransferase family enzyme/predicted kinase